MRKRGHFAAREKEVATVRKWGYPVSKEERGADFRSIFRPFFFRFLKIQNRDSLFMSKP